MGEVSDEISVLQAIYGHEFVALDERTFRLVFQVGRKVAFLEFHLPPLYPEEKPIFQVSISEVLPR